MNLYSFTEVFARHLQTYEVPVSMQGFDSNTHKLKTLGWEITCTLRAAPHFDGFDLRVEFENDSMFLISDNEVKHSDLLMFADDYINLPFKDHVVVNKIIIK